MITSLKSFSQSVTDSTSIQLKRPIVKLVIKDLITGDGAKNELVLTLGKVNILKQQVVLKDSVILKLNSQIGNFNNILLSKSDQLALSQKLSKKLELDLKKQKLKTKLTAGVGIVAIIGAILLVK
jgi:hypothetical protein